MLSTVEEKICRCGHPLNAHENAGGACWDCTGSGHGCAEYRAAGQAEAAPSPRKLSRISPGNASDARRTLRIARDLARPFHEMTERGCSAQEAQAMLFMMEALTNRALEQLGGTDA